MKKKIKYGNIKKKDLNIVLGEYFFGGSYTLKYELDKYGEDIIFAQYKIENKKFSFFRAWTKTYAMMLVNDLMEEQIILGLERELPKEYLEKK